MKTLKIIYHRLSAILFLIVLVCLHACAVNPVTGDMDFVTISEAEEINIGKQYHPQIIKQYGIYDDPELQAYVQKIGDELAAKSHRKDLIFRFTVLDSPTVNAFALPGGYVYITRGIMAYLNSEAELAGVIGHEIGHVTARHGVKKQSAATAAGFLGIFVAVKTGSQQAMDLYNILGGALISGYGREMELQSDQLGAEYLARTGYNTDNMIKVIEVLKDQEIFSRDRAKEEGKEAQSYHGLFASHPKNDTRLQEVIQSAKQYQIASTKDDGRDTYLKMIDGMVFGDSAKQGVIRNQSFYHSDLGISFKIPEQWLVENLPDRVVMHTKGDGIILQLTVDDLNKRETPEEYLKNRTDSQHSTEEQTLTINGFDAFSIVSQQNTGFGRLPVRNVVLFKDKQAYLFTGVAKDKLQFKKADDIFLQTAKSFHNMSPQEKIIAKPYHIKLINADKNTRYEDLAKSAPLPNYPAERLRLMNADYPNKQPRIGKTIKIVQ